MRFWKKENRHWQPPYTAYLHMINSQENNRQLLINNQPSVTSSILHPPSPVK